MIVLNMDWKQTKVGCYWTSGDYTISTFYEVCGGKVTRSGYRLFYRRVALDDFSYLEYAQAAAHDHQEEQNRQKRGRAQCVKV